MEQTIFMNGNASYADRCGMYQVVAAELIVAKQNSGKNDYIRFSLMKVKKNGRVDKLGFSHYFNVGIKPLVDDYKKAGVTEQGISEEALKRGLEAYEKGDSDTQFQFYGFFWTQQFGGVYKNKDTNKIASETLVFIPCDEDTGIPKPEFCMTQARLNEILQGYEKVQQDKSEAGAVVNNEDQINEEEAFKLFLEQQRKAKEQQG